jgi:predicted NUDIX family phosphoesterase
MTQTQPTKINKQDEEILVVPTKYIFNNSPIFTGFVPLHNFQAHLDIILSHKQFIKRSLAETNNNFKQIIPYLIFYHQDKFFLMRRKSTASETRLQNKYSLGIGGHLRATDMHSNDITLWAQREFHEEINYHGNVTFTPLGILNDERDLVGQVHFGLVYLLTGDSPNISIKSELKEGVLKTLDECKSVYESMESWSQLVYSYLITRV